MFSSHDMVSYCDCCFVHCYLQNFCRSPWNFLRITWKNNRKRDFYWHDRASVPSSLLYNFTNKEKRPSVNIDESISLYGSNHSSACCVIVEKDWTLFFLNSFSSLKCKSNDLCQVTVAVGLGDIQEKTWSTQRAFPKWSFLTSCKVVCSRP